MPLTYQGMLFGLLVAQGLLVTVNVPVMTLQFYATFMERRLKNLP